MIIEMYILVFLMGLSVGLLASIILFLIFYRKEIKAMKEFDERQEQYKRMI